MQKTDGVKIQDQRKQPYTTYDNKIIDSLSFEKPTTKLLYMTICRFSHMQQIFPSIGTLMLLTSINSPNTLKSHLKKLQEMKLIFIEDRGRKENGEHHTHVYHLLEVPEEILENSVWEAEKVQALREQLKEARKEKSETTKHNQHKRKDKNADVEPSVEGTSKFDGGTSNFDGGTSNFDGGTSNFDGNKERLTKQEFKTKSLKQPTNNKDAVQEPVGGLVEYTPDLIFDFYKANAEVTPTDKKSIERLCNEHPADLVYGALEIAFNSKTRNQPPIGYATGVLNNCKKLNITSLEALRSQPAPTYGKKRGNSGRTEMVPEWLPGQQQHTKEVETAKSLVVEEYKPEWTQETIIAAYNDPAQREQMTADEIEMAEWAVERAKKDKKTVTA